MNRKPDIVAAVGRVTGVSWQERVIPDYYERTDIDLLIDATQSAVHAGLAVGVFAGTVFTATSLASTGVGAVAAAAVLTYGTAVAVDHAKAALDNGQAFLLGQKQSAREVDQLERIQRERGNTLLPNVGLPGKTSAGEFFEAEAKESAEKYLMAKAFEKVFRGGKLAVRANLASTAATGFLGLLGNLEEDREANRHRHTFEQSMQAHQSKLREPARIRKVGERTQGRSSF